ncbi:hypothetical protein CKO35_01080 [Ectothiorhodospira shaposhnikovii]|uniref:porin n=1 Tax=Ectothiorhodospira shaposhnikovii TaxID=1054 RepID=UPI0019052A59|nr:porin [Ectothiorhodospira shaposhnikovii]MBK1671908.1 hypothetical protein [Ectothiorhodospira shaposhnikovii]
MKKNPSIKLSALVIIGCLLSVDTNAATVYKDEATRIDLWGRIWYGLRSGGQDNYNFDFSSGEINYEKTSKTTGSEFVDLGSRLGLRVDHSLNENLNAFLRLELRGRTDARHSDGFNQVRNTYIGLKHSELGSIQIGNFNSVLYELVSSVFELSQDWVAHTALDTGVIASNGDSLQYTSPNLHGLKLYGAVKHLSGNGSIDAEHTDYSSGLSWHAGASYTSGSLYLAAAWNQSRHADKHQSMSHDGRGAYPGGKNLYGLAVKYDFTPSISGRMTYQKLGDPLPSELFVTNFSTIEELWGLGATWSYGSGEVFANIFRAGMLNHALEDQNHYVLGATYRVAQWPLFTFAEVYFKDTASSNDARYAALNDLSFDPVYTIGARYNF